MKKIDIARERIQKNSQLLRCPICKREMTVNESNSIVCSSNHCFDLSKKGYINLLHKKVNIGYDKNMFESRNIISKSGFFMPMLQRVNDLMEEFLGDSESSKIILDAGCGEGSHITYLINELNHNRKVKITGIGIDIAKDGINVAARENSDIIWCVADLANIPFNEEQFDVVMNILSPSNYLEFKRVLKKEGILIKVIPEKNHLIELRNFFYEDSKRKDYCNEEVMDKFEENLSIIKKLRITRKRDVSKENIIHLINMTPLSWGANHEKLTDFMDNDSKEITMDLSIVIGRFE